MNDHDDELSSLFGKERRAHPASAAAKARVWSRLESSLGPSDPNGNGGGAPAAPASMPAPPVSRVVLRLAIAVGIVGIASAVWTQLPDESAAIAARTPSTAESSPRSITLAAGTTKAVDAVEPPTATARRVESAPVAAVVADAPCAICDEQRVLDPGRRGLRERHYDEALAAIGEHQSRFPNGQLAEERESLRVHVLVAMGRLHDADLAKTDFRAKFPTSPLLDSVDHAGDAQ